MIKVVIFDADGVLVNGELFSRQLARDYGISTTTTAPFFEGPFKDCVVGKADLKEVLPPYLKKWGWRQGVEPFLAYWFRAEHHVNEQLIVYIKTIRRNGIQCYLATNQEKYRVDYMLDKMEFSKSLDGIFASSLLGYKKSAKQFYTKLLAQLPEVKAEEVLFWDDTAENIKVASDFGFKAELYKNFDTFKEKMDGYLAS